MFLSGGSDRNGLVCFRVETTGLNPTLSAKWKMDVHLTNACASPTVGLSTTGVLGRPDFHALVWVADITAGNVHLGASVVQAYDALTGVLPTGSPVFNSLDFQQTQPVPDLPHYAPITCAGYSVYVGTSNGFVQFRAVPLFEGTKMVKTSF